MMQLFHANVIRLEGYGLFISGSSGSGKSAVSRALLDRAKWSHRSAALVADDYCEVEKLGIQLIARAPKNLKGAIEIRGAGLFSIPHDDKTIVTHTVCLSAKPERYPSDQIFEFEGIKLPALFLPKIGQVDIIVICQAIEAYLFEKKWDIGSHN